MSDFCNGDKKKNKIFNKKPLFFFERFFSQNTHVLVRKRDILYTSNKEIYTLHRRKKKASEKESESSAKRVLFVLSSVCFFFPSSFLFVVNEEAI